jgi:hypothetical protein
MNRTLLRGYTTLYFILRLVHYFTQIQAKTNFGREYSFTDRRGAHPPHRGGSHPIDPDGRASRDRESTPLLNGTVVNGVHSRRASESILPPAVATLTISSTRTSQLG